MSCSALVTIRTLSPGTESPSDITREVIVAWHASSQSNIRIRNSGRRNDPDRDVSRPRISPLLLPCCTLDSCHRFHEHGCPTHWHICPSDTAKSTKHGGPFTSAAANSITNTMPAQLASTLITRAFFQGKIALGNPLNGGLGTLVANGIGGVLLLALCIFMTFYSRRRSRLEPQGLRG